MDIHPPEEPIRSVGQFALHILTVTIGILIALGLEALIDLRRENQLVEHARADFRGELAHNRAMVNDDLPALATLQTKIESLITLAQDRIDRKPTDPKPLDLSRRFVTVPSTAWETAVATQAMLYIPFAETRAVSAAYVRQRAFNEMQDRAEAQWFGLAAFGDFSTIQPDGLQSALQQVFIAYAYIASVQVVERRLLTDYDDALAALKP